MSDQTQFNGVKVLQEDQTLKIQVGANDNETITIDLKQINASTLGLGDLDTTKILSSKSVGAAITAGTKIDTYTTATVQANTFTPTPGPAQTADGVYKNSAGTGYVVKAGDGQYFELATNPVTGDLTWDSGSTAVAASNVDVAGGPVSNVEISTSNVPAAITIANGPLAGGVTLSGLYKRNDAASEYITTPATDTLDNSFVTKGSDGKFYAVSVSVDTAAAGYDAADATTWTLKADVDAADMTEVSVGNVVNPGTALTSVPVAEQTITANTDLQNVAINPGTAPTADGVYALNDGGYAVKGSDGSYYAATVDTTTGNVSWDSSTAALNAADVDTSAAVTKVKTGTASATLTGLAAGETLHEVLSSSGQGTGTYVIKSGTADNPTYNYATLGTPNAAGEVAVTKGDAATVDPLAMIDHALASVDGFRSALGAVQNRFESTIANLNNTVNNLSAARSRIEDADYATEVSNMTKAQILQQAGTSVLAQANQVPQTVLSLLR
ncbi:hypothetical protein D9M72_231510 [compost metagenome]